MQTRARELLIAVLLNMLIVVAVFMGFGFCRQMVGHCFLVELRGDFPTRSVSECFLAVSFLAYASG